jgi:methionine-rich copper-binding protein CopC
MPRRSLLASIAVGAATLATLGATTLRHTALVKSEPTKDAVVTAPPTSLRLWFNEVVPVASTRVRVMRGGTAVALDTISRSATTADAPIVVPIEGVLADGLYTVQWATASKDGHPVQGSYRFTVRRTR